MKTISIAEFETLVARNDWQREQEHIIARHDDREVRYWDYDNDCLDTLNIPHVLGLAVKTSVLDDIAISYNELFYYDEYNSDSLSTTTDGQDEIWSVDGVLVVDENGHELVAQELAEYLSSDFSSIDYSVLEFEQVTDIDEDEDEDEDEDSYMATFTLEIDHAPSIRFTGELLATAESSDENGRNYSGQTGRWTELELYKTKGGKFICHKVNRTRWQGERDRFSCEVCETLAEVKEFFGNRWLAKILYAEAGIDDAIKVE